jgi:hypothetical protein
VPAIVLGAPKLEQPSPESVPCSIVSVEDARPDSVALCVSS